MKKNSAFMLRSGNKPSIAKLMGVSPIKDEKVKGSEPEPEPAEEKEPAKEDEPDKPKYTDRETIEYVMKLGYGPRKIPVGPRQK